MGNAAASCCQAVPANYCNGKFQDQEEVQLDGQTNLLHMKQAPAPMLNSKRITFNSGRQRRKQDKRALAESLSPVRDLSPVISKDGMIVIRGERGQ